MAPILSVRKVHVGCAQHYKHKRNESARHPSSNKKTGDDGQLAAFSVRAQCIPQKPAAAPSRLACHGHYRWLRVTVTVSTSLCVVELPFQQTEICIIIPAPPLNRQLTAPNVTRFCIDLMEKKAPFRGPKSVRILYIERTPDFGSNWGVGGNSVTESGKQYRPLESKKGF